LDWSPFALLDCEPSGARLRSGDGLPDRDSLLLFGALRFPPRDDRLLDNCSFVGVRLDLSDGDVVDSSGLLDCEFVDPFDLPEDDLDWVLSSSFIDECLPIISDIFSMCFSISALLRPDFAVDRLDRSRWFSLFEGVADNSLLLLVSDLDSAVSDPGPCS
jgi:hypothetical protein